MLHRSDSWLEPIAIIGIGSRFPGARSTEEFWRLLREGRDVITEVPRDRFDVRTLYDPTPGTTGKLISKWGGFIDEIDQFDAPFFGITAREARRMDPQQRLALEVAYQAFENAGVRASALKTSPVGVFVGVGANEYQELEHRDLTDLDVLVASGGGRNGVAGRISYSLGLQGPSIAIDTDRSSSLVAVYLACESVRSGASTTALAGATNLILSPEPSLGFSHAMMLSPDGRCKFGDSRADGFVRSDGIAFVVLKKLSAALADGDRVHATILGGAVNHDAGRSGDFLAPSSASQIPLLRAAYESAGVDPGDVQYVEAHGPGTKRGDPEEVRALATVLQRDRGHRPPLLVGSVKTNIGHTEMAAGIAGLIKVALSLSHRTIPATLHFQTPSPSIQFDGIIVPTTNVDWPDSTRPLLAGVTSLGLTGTNAHLVLGEPPRSVESQNEATQAEREEVLTISAKNPQSLMVLGERYVELVRDAGAPPIHGIAYTASVRREHHDFRLAVVGANRDSVVTELETALKRPAVVAKCNSDVKIAFVFPGQGSQWLGMGRELLRREPAFRESMESCDEAIRRVAGWSLIEELAADDSRSRLSDFSIVQPALVSIEISLARQWQALGIEPSVVVGTSMGEVAAAHVAGILTLDDAIKIICRRSALMTKRFAGKTGMGVIGLPVHDVEPFLADDRNRIWIAGVNSPVSTIVAGEREALDDLLGRIKGTGVHVATVKDMLSSHTPHVDEIAGELSAALSDVAPMTGHVPMLSSVNGEVIRGGLGGDYWVQNLRQPIRFAEAVPRLLASGHNAFIEVSPHPVLVGAVLDGLARTNHKALAIGSLRRNQPERHAFLSSVAELYSFGLDVDWRRLFPGHPTPVDLPAYPFRRERYWYTDQPIARARPKPVLGAPVPSEADVDVNAAGSEELANALPQRLRALQPTERRAWVLEHVRGQIAAVLGSAAELVELRRPLRELGLTSFLGLELTSLLSRWFGRTFAPTLLFNHPTVEALVEYLTNEIAPASSAATAESLHQVPGDLSHETSEPIAIVGMACRFPGASDPEAFWRLLNAGVDAIVEVPRERWDTERVHDPNPAKKSTTKWGGFVDAIDKFDASFFGITPREAEEMDPQQRLLLEITSEALENAGQSREELTGSPTGVFVGITNNNDYVSLKRLADNPLRVRSHHGTGMATSVAAGRISYTFGLNGPAIAIDTACSSSLVAIHLAIQSLRSRECRMALVGGVNAILSPEISLAYSQAGMLSPTGRCKTFDASADGYVRGEGCGVVVLKRLSDAQAHGDNVLAVLLGSAVNQDGRSSGLTAPNGTAQQALVRKALATASVRACDVGYVEAHGTGTPLGDPIEIQALGEVLKEGRPTTKPLVVGSVKTNVGHLEAAAGIAGLMKVVLALQHQTIPRHLHFQRVNPFLGIEKLPIEIPVTATAWPLGSERRIAGVSSFGFSGTNCHVVLEEPPRTPPKERGTVEAPLHIVPVSARNPAALAALAQRYADHLASHPDQSLGDVSYTASVGRTHLEERAVVVAASLEETCERLQSLRTGVDSTGVVRGRVELAARPRIAFLFTGQGAQYFGMGRALYETHPVFRDALDRCAALLHAHLPEPLLSVLYSSDRTPSVLSQTAYTQPALFAIEYALSELWRSWGIVPEAVLGHSVGEYAAACVAGVMSLDDAIRLIAARGRLMQALSERGAMASIRASEQRVRALLNGRADGLSIAAINGPNLVVVSGLESAVIEICTALGAEGVQTRRLDVSHAFHSPLMDPMLDEFERVVSTIRLEVPRLPVASNLTGELGGAELATSGYWRRHVREPVRFADGIGALKARGIDTFVELGPHPSLLAMGAQCVSEGYGRWIPSLRRQRSDWETLLDSVARLHVSGAQIEWDAFHRPYTRRRTSLPTYAWQKQRYWIEGARNMRRSGQDAGHELLGGRIWVAGASRGRRRGEGAAKVFENVLSTTAYPYLADHIVFEKAVLPAAAYLELARAASDVHWGSGPHRVQDFVVQSPVVLSETEGRRIQLVFSEEAQDTERSPDETVLSVALYSQPAETAMEDDWVLHGRGQIHRDSVRTVERVDLEALRASFRESEDVALTYGALRDAGLNYGPAFQALKLVFRSEHAVLAGLVTDLPQEGYGIHPVVVDAGLQALVSIFRNEDHRVYLPFEIGSFVLWNRTGVPAWIHATTREAPRAHAETVSGAVTILDDQGEILAELTDVKLKHANANMHQGPRAWRAALYELAWRETRPAASSNFAPRGTWVVLTDGSETGNALVSRLEDAGVRVFAMHTPWSGRPACEALLAEACRSGQVESVVCFWRALAGVPHEAGERTAVAGLELVQAVLRMEQPPRLWWVTEGAQPVRQGEGCELTASTIWGLGRTVMQEHPELRCTLVDLEPKAPDAVLRLWDELGAPAEEPERAVRGGHLFVPRLAKPAAGLHVPSAPNYHLRNARKGQLDHLQLVTNERRSPAPGEVEIEVEATGLNFRDVMNALGVYPGDAGSLGLECAGVVRAIGQGVSHVALGDRVMALAPAAFSRFVTVNAGFVIRAFEELSTAESAAFPIAFLTAYHAFGELAGLRAGERVLIHAAAGGVGMAAVQVAKWMGAEVFATASPSKWDLVRAMGVEHIASSRTLEFADAFRQVTGERGIDVVLNALAGDFTDASLALLGAGGRFIEMGKTDLRDPATVASTHPGISYQAFDLLSLGAGDIAKKLHALADAFSAGVLRPLPVTCFPLTDAEKAFRMMAQARHTGKVVLLAPHATRSRIRANITALITGGLGALGLRVAEWMIREHRVAHVVLVGRSAPSSTALAEVERLRGIGADITVAQADVAVTADLHRVLDAIPERLPLRTVIHAAGVLDDGVLSLQDPARLARVLRPKVAGAWNLHEATRHKPLDNFVLFSSITSVLGSAGQSSYASANGFLDALANERRSLGLPALSINWGPWAEGGMASKLQGNKIVRPGWEMLAPEGALALLEEAFSRAEPQLSGMSLDVRTLLGPVNVAPMWRELAPKDRRTESVAEKPSARLAKLPPEARAREMEASVRMHVAKISGLAPTDLPLETPLRELGLDSLMVVELRNRLSAELAVPFPASLVFDYPTIAKLTEYLLVRLAVPEAAVGGAGIRVQSSSDATGAGGEDIGSALVRSGVLSPEQLVLAREVQAEAKTRSPLGRILLRLGLATPHQLQQVLAAELHEPIAIIGLACRFPGADDADAFWQLLESGTNAVTPVPSDRWDTEAYFDRDSAAPGKTYARWGGFLSKDVYRFDAAFFGISPQEASRMDPRQRILLETTWNALENAGQAAAGLAGRRVGVFLGLLGNNDYAALKHTTSDPCAILGHDATGDAISVAGGRLSYFLGVTGPNVTIDTACSSSLVALHLACQSLRTGESRMAIVGGVSLTLAPETTIAFSKARMLSPQGRCATFDAKADGYVRGEGCGILILKSLSDAQADGDNILAVVKGTAVNQDGRSNGLTAPSGRAQEELIRDALAAGGVAAGDVSYLEAHGTGTRLGDPIEVAALGAVLNDGRDPARPLTIGSVKTNIGHLEPAAGVAALIKVVLSLKHEKLPRHLHFTTINPEIEIERLRFRIPIECEAWPRTDRPRIAGISSFGFSGTNAHVIVEEPPLTEVVGKQVGAPQILAISAKTAPALQEAAARNAEFVATCGRELSELCASYNVGRSHLDHRVAVLADDVERTSELLAAAARGECPEGVFQGSLGAARPRIAFLYSGEASPYLRVGHELYTSSRAFRDVVDRCAVVSDALTGGSLRETLFGERGCEESPPVDGATARFALECGLTELWRSFGIVPHMVMGYGGGEYAAACGAGLVSIEDAVKMIAERTALTKSLTEPGVSALVFASAEEIETVLRHYATEVSIAAFDGPREVRVAGTTAGVTAVLAELKARGIEARKLDGLIGMGSATMDALVDKFEGANSSPRREGGPRMISTLEGRVVDPSDVAPPGHWGRLVREPIQFEKGMRALAAEGCNVFVEIGVGRELLRLGRECVSAGAVWIASLGTGQGPWRQVLEALAELYVRGARVEWSLVHDGVAMQHDLPPYPFGGSRLFLAPAARQVNPPRVVELPTAPSPRRRASMEPSTTRNDLQSTGHPLLGSRVPMVGATVAYETVLTPTTPSWLIDHRVGGQVVVPGAALAELIRAAVEDFTEQDAQVTGLVIQAPLVVAAPQRLQLVLDEGGAQVSIYAQLAQAKARTPWTLHATSRFGGVPSGSGIAVDLAAIRERCREAVDVAATYASFESSGFGYGSTFRGLRRLWRGENEALGEVKLSGEIDAVGYGLHPALLDASLQASAALFRGQDAWIPFGIDRLVVHRAGQSTVHVHVRTESDGPDRRPSDTRSVDVTLTNAEGELVAEVVGLSLRRADVAALRA